MKSNRAEAEVGGVIDLRSVVCQGKLLGALEEKEVRYQAAEASLLQSKYAGRRSLESLSTSLQELEEEV